MAAPEGGGQHVPALLSFDTLITPRIIVWLYAALLVGALAGGAAAVLSVGPNFPGFASALVIVAAGALAARVLCELLLVLFRINEHMQAVSKRL